MSVLGVMSLFLCSLNIDDSIVQETRKVQYYSPMHIPLPYSVECKAGSEDRLITFLTGLIKLCMPYLTRVCVHVNWILCTTWSNYIVNYVSSWGGILNAFLHYFVSWQPEYWFELCLEVMPN